MYQAIYQSASPTAELLNARGALPYRHVPEAVDYWSEIPEDAALRGRVLIHRDAAESMSDGGRHSIESMAAAAARDGQAGWERFADRPARFPGLDLPF